MQFQNRRDLFMAFDELFDAAIMQEIMRSPREMSTSIPDNQFKLLSDDPKVINRFCTRYHFMYSTKRVTSNFAKYLTNEASELIKYLQKEYHLNKKSWNQFLKTHLVTNNRNKAGKFIIAPLFGDGIIIPTERISIFDA